MIFLDLFDYFFQLKQHMRLNCQNEMFAEQTDQNKVHPQQSMHDSGAAAKASDALTTDQEQLSVSVEDVSSIDSKNQIKLHKT